MPPGWRDAQNTVREYDDSLTLGRRPEGEWLVCKKRDGANPHPVLSLGFSPEAPSRELILEKLFKGDVRRNAERIVNAIVRHNERKKAELSQAASEAAGEWAEYAEHATRGERG